MSLEGCGWPPQGKLAALALRNKEENA